VLVTQILIIDDDNAMALTVERMLRRKGHEVLIAQDGFIGLKLFEKHRPPLVITDILMPEKEGLSTLREIKAVEPRTKVIAISRSAAAEYDVLDLAGKLGADKMMAKPFRAVDLIAMVNELLKPPRVQ
jgi:DNA-binding response OmpR family regulator